MHYHAVFVFYSLRLVDNDTMSQDPDTKEEIILFGKE